MAPELVVELPTAVQAAGDGHDTPFRLAEVPGLGVAWIAQLVPFQRSIRAWPVSSEEPTAVQAAGDEHAAPDSAESVEPAGLVVGWIVQALLLSGPVTAQAAGAPGSAAARMHAASAVVR